MNDAGYTLIEVLAALVMVGLAVAGLLGSIEVMGRQQWRAAGLMADNEALRLAGARLEALLRPWGPYRSADAGGLSGDGSRFSYRCGAAGACQVTLAVASSGLTLTSENATGEREVLPLRQPAPGVLAYEGLRGETAVWPPQTGAADALRAVVVVGSGGPDRPLVVARIWPEEPRSCAFDAISQDCR